MGGKGFVQVNGRGRRAWDASGDLVLHTSTEIQAAASPLLWAIPAHLYLQEAMRQSHCTLTMESLGSVLGQHRPQHQPLHSATTTSLQPNPPAQAQQDPAFRLTCRAPCAAQPRSPGLLPLPALALVLSPVLTALGTCPVFDISWSLIP